jgi:peptidoglycan/xylan/chitin deacetylase (PgdA/CDA1 family)
MVVTGKGKKQRMVPVLTYHRVGPATVPHVPTVSAEAFEAQLALLRRWGRCVVPLSELINDLTGEKPLPRSTVVITFDDGYEETANIAAPLLRAYGFCATVFIAPEELERPGFLSWPQVQKLARDGFTVGSHTMRHTFLPTVPRDHVRQELVESKRVLEERLGQSCRWLSYPIGGYTPEIQAIAREVGYEAACTTNRGLSKRAMDLFAIRRIKMTERDRGPIRLWAKLSGWYDAFRRLEPPA